MIRWVVGILSLLVIGSGTYFYFVREDPLKTLLDRRWPPVTAEQQRQAAIDSAATALKTLVAPNVAAGADVATIREVAFNALKPKGVTKISLTTEKQLLRMTADFDMTLAPDALPQESDKRSLIAALAPHVIGKVELFLTAAVSVSDAPERTLLVKLLPAVSRVRIDKVTVKGNYDATAAADAIALLLDRYADNLSAALTARPFMQMSLPAIVEGGFDPSGPIGLNLKEAPGLKLSLSAHPVKSPFGLRSAALLIDQDNVIVIAEIAPLDKLPAQVAPAKGSFGDVRTAFKKALENGLGITDHSGGAWAAVGKALIAQGLDNAFAQAQPCLDGAGPIPNEPLSAKIPTPDGSGIDCTPTRDCTPRLDCTPTEDCTPSRNCDAVKDCSGYKWYQAADKARCEIEKSAAKFDCERIKSQEKAKCETGKAGRKLDCERLKSQKKAQCELEKTGQKTACEAEKGAIVALHRTGNIGNVNGSVEGAASLRLCFKDVHFSQALDKLALTVAASGSATLNTHFKFVPLDVGGHILCPFEWTADKEITTTVPPQSIGASLSLTRESSPGVLKYRGRLNDLPIKLHFQPSPLSLVLQNVNFDLACPVAADLINGLTLGLAPFIPEFLTNYTYELKPVTFSFTPDLPSQSILGHDAKLKLSDTSLALIVSGTL